MDLPYEVLESRLRIFTATTLLPKRAYLFNEIETFLRAHLEEIDSHWRRAVESFMSTIDAYPAATMRRELVVELPAKSIF